jgi:sugar lactone lactonase YvrE
LLGGVLWWASPGVERAASGARVVPSRPPANPATCRGWPAFAAREGLGEQTLIGTRDTLTVGLVLSDPASRRVYRHPTWDDAGYLGGFALDAAGNIYVAPAPQTSLARNPPAEQNRVYRIDSQTGEMQLFATLPAAASPDPAHNPFGAMGLFVDCATNSLYVTSVAGSTRAAEVGRVFRLDLANGTVTSQRDGIDAIGVAVYGDVLLVGRARTPEVWGIPLDSSGNLSGPPALAFSVAQALRDGTGKVRRMAIDPDGNLALTISPFSYTLEPPASQRDQRLVYRVSNGAWKPAPTPG